MTSAADTARVDREALLEEYIMVLYFFLSDDPRIAGNPDVQHRAVDYMSRLLHVFIDTPCPPRPSDGSRDP